MMRSAAETRQEAGLTLSEAAKRARICPVYLRRIELHGNAPYILATRLAHLYNCSATLFLYAPPATVKAVTGPAVKKPSEGHSRRPKPLSDGRKPSIASCKIEKKDKAK